MIKKNILLIIVLFLGLFLRLFRLGDIPPHLSWDEASLGYNAYCILNSGQDEHGEPFPLDRFIAFGDYKPPGYIYAAVPSIFLKGLSETGVRLPSSLAGAASVYLAYLLVREVFPKRKKMALLASFLLAVSPWSLHLSRAAYEANLASFFSLAGIYFFYLSFRKKWPIIFSALFFVLSFYTFNANRIIAPLLAFFLCLINIKNICKIKKWLFVSLLLACLLLLPSINYLKSPESRLRFQEVSIFNNLTPVKKANARIERDGNSFFSRIIHNRRLLFASDYLKHYFDNFSPRFLFTHGDVNPRLFVQSMGQLYIWEMPFLILGIVFFLVKRDRRIIFLLVWMMVVVVPAGMARETPHALRIVSILPAYQIITAFGLSKIFKYMNFSVVSKLRKTFLFLGVSCLFSVNIFYYLHDYYIHFPNDWSGEWQYGYRQMVKYVSSRKSQYDNIYVTSSLGRPYIFFAYFDKIPCSEYRRASVVKRDVFGFYDVESIGNIHFNLDSLVESKGSVLAVTSGDSPQGFHTLKQIRNLKGDIVFVISEKN